MNIRTLSLAALAVCCALPLHAKTFRWSSASDIPTLDIHSQNNALGNGVHAAIYESQVYYNSKTFTIEPMLATAWKQVSPTHMQFTLREGVKFSDGSALTAEDVKFSIERAMAKTSNYHVFTQGIDRVEAGAGSIDIHTKSPNPVLLNQLTELRIMSKAWAEKNNSTQPKDIKTKEESFAHRNAMGSGPFMVKEWQPDQRLVLVDNPNWWGHAAKAKPGNVTEIVYSPIKSEATRMAALLSGQVDLVLDPTPQDLQRVQANKALKVVTGPENRTIFFGMNQGATELRSADVKGRNPFADKRVREAMNIAINREAVKRVVMRGQSVPAGIVAPPFIDGYDKALDVVPTPDVARAKALLAEAGYPDGFSVTLSCPNDRYVNDEAICQAATGMFGQIGVKARLDARPKSIHFAELPKGELDLYMLGWGVPTMDSHYVFHYLYETRTDKGGSWNVTGYSSPRVDELTKAMNREIDLGKRAGMVAETWKTVQDDVVYLPIHHQMLNWAMKDDIDFPVQSENYPYFKLLKYRK